MSKNVYLNDFQAFPKAILAKDAGLEFAHYLNRASARNVNQSRLDYFAQRLAQAEERVFSHVELYQRAKLTQSDKDAPQTTVYNVHSCLGSAERKWLLGLILQKEDGDYYLEDNTFCVKLSFAQLEYVEPDAFFTEMSVVLAEGKYENGMFHLLTVMHPPLHANKQFRFKINE